MFATKHSTVKRHINLTKYDQYLVAGVAFNALLNFNKNTHMQKKPKKH